MNCKAVIIEMCSFVIYSCLHLAKFIPLLTHSMSSVLLSLTCPVYWLYFYVLLLIFVFSFPPVVPPDGMDPVDTPNKQTALISKMIAKNILYSPIKKKNAAKKKLLHDNYANKLHS